MRQTRPLNSRSTETALVFVTVHVKITILNIECRSDLGGGVEVKFNTDILTSDFVVDLPVMKTHSIFENMALVPGKFLKRYAGRPEFDESFYKVK